MAINLAQYGRGSGARVADPGCPKCSRLEEELWAYQGLSPHHHGALSSLCQPGGYPVHGDSNFGDPDISLDRTLPGRPNTWRCELTGQYWTGDPISTVSPPAAQRSVPSVVRPKPASPPAGAKVRPLCQSNRSSCGQASVAMGINALTGKSLTDTDIARRYGYGLLYALNNESKVAGYRWIDGGNFTKKNWAGLEKRLNKERTPVLIGLNGPTFSPSGRGHIVTLLSIDGQKVRYADPADGRIKVTTRRAIEDAPGHPDGKFFFYAARGR